MIITINSFYQKLQHIFAEDKITVIKVISNVV